MNTPPCVVRIHGVSSKAKIAHALFRLSAQNDTLTPAGHKKKRGQAGFSKTSDFYFSYA